MLKKARNRSMEFKCPICGKVVKPATETKEARKDQTRVKNFPFCSERCKLIDMGAWFDGEYGITADEQGKEDFGSQDDAK